MLCRVLAVGATLLKHASVFVSSHAGCQSCCRVKEQERLDVTRVKPTVWWREQRLRLYWRSTAANSPQERNKTTADRHWCSDSVYTEHVWLDETRLFCCSQRRSLHWKRTILSNTSWCIFSWSRLHFSFDAPHNLFIFPLHLKTYIYFHAGDFLVILYIILLTASLWCFGPSDLNNCTRILQSTDV